MLESTFEPPPPPLQPDNPSANQQHPPNTIVHNPEFNVMSSSCKMSHCPGSMMRQGRESDLGVGFKNISRDRSFGG